MIGYTVRRRVSAETFLGIVLSLLGGLAIGTALVFGVAVAEEQGRLGEENIGRAAAETGAYPFIPKTVTPFQPSPGGARQ